MVTVFHSIEHHTIPQSVPFPCPLQQDAYKIPEEDYQRIWEISEKHGNEVLEGVMGLFDKAGALVDTRLVKDESPEHYAIRIAKEENFDLIILGCSGHHWKIRRALMGTVATKVINEAGVDVLIVR